MIRGADRSAGTAVEAGDAQIARTGVLSVTVSLPAPGHVEVFARHGRRWVRVSGKRRVQGRRVLRVRLAKRLRGTRRVRIVVVSGGKRVVLVRKLVR